MNLFEALIILGILFAFELIYFKIADKLNIVDKPNHRSSHNKITIRGGGIIFSISILLAAFCFGLHYEFFLLGLMLIAVISFLDDINPISNLIRLIFHITAAVLMIWQMNRLDLPAVYFPVILFVIIGTINAVNFMDGINGITGIYSFITLVTLYYLNNRIHFVDANYLITAVLAVLVFCVFNCRAKAKCFAGDVGSVGIAFIIIFFLLQLIIKSQNINYIFLIIVYALDTFTTILFRLVRKEKITAAHRSHFYQYLANEKKYPHLFIATMYGLSQLLINIAIVANAHFNFPVFILLLMLATVTFLILRIIIEGKRRLLGVNF